MKHRQKRNTIEARTLTFIPSNDDMNAMGRIEVVSFDMEGTLIDTTFSDLIWETDIPTLYGQRHGLDLETAKERVLREYDQVGDERIEWYDAGYWFRRLGLPGDWRRLLERRADECRVYPEVRQALESLVDRYPLIISSNTIREFLEVQLRMLPPVFTHVFSAPSDFETVKAEEFYERICLLLGVHPDAVVHVGDSRKFDFEPADRLGIQAYHLDRTGGQRGEKIVHDLLEFTDRVKELEESLSFQKDVF